MVGSIWKLSGAVLLAGILASCSEQGGSSVMKSEMPSAISAQAQRAQSKAVDASADASASGDVAEGTASNITQTDPKTATPALYLAYSYEAALELPFANVVSTMNTHRQKCEQAGPTLCQIVGASSDAYGDDQVRAQLQLRATPTWLASFRGGLEADVKAGNGKLKSQSVSSEDLTATITDTEVRLRALRALRTRIEGLIASRPARLADLLEAERELARVQGEIDAFDSSLAIARARVSMSNMSLQYETKPSAVAGGTFAPVGDAFTGFFGVLAQSLSVLIGLIAAVIPFALVLGPLAYFGFKWRAKRRQARVSQSGSTAP